MRRRYCWRSTGDGSGREGEEGEVNIYAKHGTKVRFIGCSEDQHNWGSHTGNPQELVKGALYEVERTEVHTQHTKVFLVGHRGCFNSVCFEDVPSRGKWRRA